ncbi:reverse transcriptase domain-containing protein [Tanacetum coccineum]
MKLNPKKCTFGAEEGAFLGHVVSMQGIKPCPEKAEAVMKLQSPQTLNEAQSLNRKLVSFNRFLSKSEEKSLPFFKPLKRCVKKSDFQWTPEAERAFQNMKKCIVELPMVTEPKPKEELIMYLYAAREVHVSRSENKKEDELSKIASTSFAHLTKQVLVETLKRKSIEEREILAVVEEEGHCWMTPLVQIPWRRKSSETMVTHPQTKGQVERASRSLRDGVKAKVGEDNKNWVKEVPYVLWAHRMMIKTSNGDTPFSLTYGTEAVILVEIWMPSIRYASVNQAENDEGLLLNLDILEERREKAVVREARNKAKMEKYYNAKVRSTSFRLGDFVYRSNEASHAKKSRKLGPKWKGPYEVVEALGKGVYKLRNGSGDVLPRI